MPKKLTNKPTFFDLYSGIGGFRIAFEKAGAICAGYSEIDKKAVEVYKKNFNTDGELEIGDITKTSDLPSVDFLTGGVPCQSWSIAGKMRGFDDSRGKLWLDTIKVTSQIKPKGFIYENVKGLADPRNKPNLNLIIREFQNLNYNVYYKVLNAFDFGLPQSRERIFIIGIRKDCDKGIFSFPKKIKHLPSLINILEVKQKIKTSRLNHIDDTSSFRMASVVNKGNFFIFSDVRNGDYTIHSWDLIKTTKTEKEVCIRILKNRRRKTYGEKDGNPMSLDDILLLFGNKVIEGFDVGEKDINNLVSKKILRKVGDKYEFVNSKISAGINGIYRIFLPQSHVFSTLTKSGSRDFVTEHTIPDDVKNKKRYFLKEIYGKKEYRTITIREGARIQGFPDEFVFGTGYNTSLGLLGNSLAVNIAKELAKNLVKSIK